MTQYLSLMVDDGVADYLDALSCTGLYGGDRNSVAEHLILEGLRSVVGHRHLVPIRYRVEEEPAAAPAMPKTHGPNCKCTTDDVLECGAVGCFAELPF